MYPIFNLWSWCELTWRYKFWIFSVFLHRYNYEIGFSYLSSFRKRSSMIIGIGSLKPAIPQPFFSLGCLQAVTPCLGLIITALMKKQTEQPIIRFICPLGFTNIAMSQAAALSFWLQCFMGSLTEWSHTVICGALWGEQHAVSLETAKLCTRLECMSQKGQEEKSVWWEISSQISAGR